MSSLPSLGEQESAVLRFISAQESLTVREVAEHFEQHHGLARTTVMTMMERLRKKGLLAREKENGIFRYSAKIESQNLMRRQIGEFVNKTLGGSVSPLLSFFAENSKLSEKDLRDLKSLVQALEAEEKRGKS